MAFEKHFKIENKLIGGKKTFVIAEIGSNHNQDINLAYELIDAAVESGADAVKFQSIKADKIYRIEDLDSQFLEVLKAIELKEDWHHNLMEYCLKKNIMFFSCPTYLEVVDLLVQTGVKLMKIASPQTYGFPKLIEKVGLTGLPTIMSTGYCNYSEIERAVKLFEQTGNKKLILLHCVSNYPTPYDNVNLNFIETLSRMFNVVTGFSDHTLDYHVTIAAVTKGAKVIEKHFTLSRNMKGPDHFLALEPKEFKEMVKCIRDVEKALGDTHKPGLMPFEVSFRDEIEMKIFASKDIVEGQKFRQEDIMYLRSRKGLGISAWQEDIIIGRKMSRSVKKSEMLEHSDFLDQEKGLTQ